MQFCTSTILNTGHGVSILVCCCCSSSLCCIHLAAAAATEEDERNKIPVCVVDQKQIQA